MRLSGPPGAEAIHSTAEVFSALRERADILHRIMHIILYQHSTLSVHHIPARNTTHGAGKPALGDV